MITYKDKGIPKRLWIEDSLWKKIIGSVPLLCMDIIFQRKDGAILYGFRVIKPYKNTWTLIGGRLLYKEPLKGMVKRLSREYGLEAKESYLNGIFPLYNTIRSDVSISVAVPNPRGTPIVDGKEFTKLVWLKTPPKRLAGGYLEMVTKWNRARRSRTFLKLNRME